MNSIVYWPDSWTKANFGDLFELKYGKGLPERDRRPGRIPVYGSNGVVGQHDRAVTTGPSILVGRKGSVGKLHFEPGPCWPIDTTYYIEKSPWNWHFTLALLRQLGLDQMDRSTAIPGLTRSDVYELEVAYPEPKEQELIAKSIELVSELLSFPRNRLATIPALLKKFRQSVLAAACSGQLTADWRAKHPSLELVEYGATVSDFPETWRVATIGEVARTSSGGTPSRSNKQFYGGTIPWIKSGDLNDGVVTQATEFLTTEGLRRSSAKLFPKNTLLIAMYGATVGKLGLLGFEAATNQAVCGIFLREDISLQFTFRYLLYIRQDLIDRAKGGAQPNISQEIVRNTPIPIPLQSEQAEIVRRVDTLFALADSVESRLSEATAQVERTTQSILAKAFRGEL